MITPEVIAKVTAREFSVPLARLLGRGREAEAVEARHAAMWLAERVSACSLTEIGERTTGFAPNNVQAGIAAIDERRDEDPSLAERLDGLVETCRAIDRVQVALNLLPAEETDPVAAAHAALTDDDAPPGIKAMACAVLAATEPADNPLVQELVVSVADVILAAHVAPESLSETVAGALEPAFIALTDAEVSG